MHIQDVAKAARFSPEKMSKVNLCETPRFFCDLYCLRPGQEQKVHSHAENDKIYYILTGEATVIVNEEKSTLRAGELVLAVAGAPHGIRNDSTGDTVCMVFMAPHPSAG